MSLLFAVVFLFHQAVSAFTVSGTITDYITNAPAADVTVRFIAYSPAAKTDSARTGINGKYTITGAPGAIYMMRLEDDRYAVDTGYVTISNDTILNISVYDRSHTLVNGSIPDTLTKVGSPYLVAEPIYVLKPLVIAPGTKIMFVKRTSFVLYDTVYAIGSQNDSIVFEAKRDSSMFGSIMIRKPNAVYRFEYCRFDRLNWVVVGPTGDYLQYVDVEHCLFHRMYGALLCDYTYKPARRVKFSNNRVVGGMKGIGTLSSEPLKPMADTVEVTDNFIESTCDCDAIGLKLQDQGKCYVRRNTIMGKAVFDCSASSLHDTVASNIFIDLTFQNASNKPLFFAYNDHSASGTMPIGIGTNITKNGKGDSCDAFFNIIKKPLFADSTTGVLQSSSPCIGTGMGGENMGVYQGGSVVIAEHNTVRISKKGSFKSLAVRTSGDQTMIRFSWQGNPVAGKGWISLYTVTGALITKIPFEKSQSSAYCVLRWKGSGVVVAAIQSGEFKESARLRIGL